MSNFNEPLGAPAERREVREHDAEWGGVRSSTAEGPRGKAHHIHHVGFSLPGRKRKRWEWFLRNRPHKHRANDVPVLAAAA